MKLLTWNINGLRATTFSGNFTDVDGKNGEVDDGKYSSTVLVSGTKSTSIIKSTITKSSSIKSLETILARLDADIICFQEVKTPRDQLEESLALVPGFTSFFSFCRKRPAYSGVATYSKDSCSPFRVEEGLSGVLTCVNGTKDGNELVGNYGDLSGFSKEELKGREGRTVLF